MTSDVQTLQHMVRIAAMRLRMENPDLYTSMDGAIEVLERAAQQDIAFEVNGRPWFNRYPLDGAA